MNESDSTRKHSISILRFLTGCGLFFLVILIILAVGEIDSIQSDVQLFKFLLTALLIVLLVAIYIIMTLMINKRIWRLIRQAEKIGEKRDYSEVLDTDGPFREINVLADAYNRLLNQINHSLQKQKQFNHDVSHELKTPITVLKAQLQLSKEQFGDQPDAMRNITVIDRQVNRMDLLVQRLLELSRLEQGQVFDHTESVDLTAVIESICEDFVIVKERSDLFALTLEPVTITANNSLIHTMLRNLIENAVKYSPEESQVEIALYRSEADVCVVITDHGIGMSNESIPHVFDLFYRAEEARSTEGFGLGLTLVDRIAGVYHGHVEVESTEGEGSTFTVILPDS